MIVNCLFVAFLLFAAQLILAAADKTTPAPSTPAPNTTTVPAPTDNVPFSAPNISGPAAGAAFYTIGGLVIVAQVIYCVVWTRKDAKERAQFNAEIEEAGLVGGPQGSSIDMKHEP